MIKDLSNNDAEQILAEIRELKQILSKVIGSIYESPGNKFSVAAQDKAAKDFQKWAINRGDWVGEDEIKKYIKLAPWNAGAFIRKELAFASWFRRGQRYLYSKKDLIALGKELSDRNIDLKRYKEFLEDKAAFDRKAAKDLHSPLKRKGKSKPFYLPKGLKNIATAGIPKPDPGKPYQDLARLKTEFKRDKLSGYIDIYKGTHAMLRHLYPYARYLEPALLRQCRKWVQDFNVANDAIEKITGKRKNSKSTIPKKYNYNLQAMDKLNEIASRSILLYQITTEEFYDRLRQIIKEQMQQNQFLTKEGALKMSGVSNATFLKAIHEGKIKPQLVKGRTRAMYLESEVLKIEKKRKPRTGP